MWLIPVQLDPAVDAQLVRLGVLAAVFVVAVLLALLATRRRRRREIRRLACPVHAEQALIVVERSPDGDAHVLDCSHWHDGRVACGERCIRDA
jgi:hypothetical protein